MQLLSYSIILVHGLQGNQFNMWSSGDTFWPHNLLAKSLRNIRIISYGYNLDITSHNSILQHAENLVQDICDLRRTKEVNRILLVSNLSHLFSLLMLRITSRERLIIFVAHNLGGIVVKQVYLCPNLTLL